MEDFAEGWEYAPLFTMKYHHKERKMDLVRRRRWHCKMVAETPGAPCFFQIKSSQVRTEARDAGSAVCLDGERRRDFRSSGSVT